MGTVGITIQEDLKQLPIEMGKTLRALQMALAEDLHNVAHVHLAKLDPPVIRDYQESREFQAWMESKVPQVLLDWTGYLDYKVTLVHRVWLEVLD